jgi:hypothetical protein
LTGQGRWHTTSVQILDAQSAVLLLLQGDRSKKITEKDQEVERDRACFASLTCGINSGFSGSEASIL